VESAESRDFHLYRDGSVRDIATGDAVVVASSGRRSLRPGIAEALRAQPGDAITIADGRCRHLHGAMCWPARRPDVSDQFHAHVIWMSERARQIYLGRIGTKATAISP